MRPADRDPVLLIGFGDEHSELALRVQLLGCRPLRAEDPVAARLMLSRVGRPVRAAILSADAVIPDRGRALARLATSSGGMDFVVAGKRPPPDVIDEMRRDGIRQCLWGSFTDGELRFVINRALFDTTRGEGRLQTRVPTDLTARVKTASGERRALVYNLSLEGAYLESSRTGMPGGRVGVILPLPGGDLGIAATVISTNVTGNLKRENLPMGMGIAFEDLDGEGSARLEQYIAARAGAFDL